MAVYFTSDWHLGHPRMAQLRGFSSLEEHDDAVLEPFRRLAKKDKLFILGDVVWGNKALPKVGEVRCYKEMLYGNHDTFKAPEYLKYMQKLHGCRSYKGWFLTHIPVHPQELRYKGNIHGHIHSMGGTSRIADPRYFCVNWDFHKGPVNFEEIEESLKC